MKAASPGREKRGVSPLGGGFAVLCTLVGGRGLVLVGLGKGGVRLMVVMRERKRARAPRSSAQPQLKDERALDVVDRVLMAAVE